MNWFFQKLTDSLEIQRTIDKQVKHQKQSIPSYHLNGR